MSTLATNDIPALMLDLGQAAKAAAAELAVASTDAKNTALRQAAQSLRDHSADILEANALDMAAGEEKGLKGSFLDRLLLSGERIEAMAVGLESIADLPDPVGVTLSEWDRPNGLKIERVSTPLGVIGVIYESRPNVTADAGSLCLKAGNAVILRGGSESFHSASAIMASLAQGLKAAGLPEASIQLVPTRERAAVGEMLRLSEFIDVIVPRGGKSLIERITEESRIPMFKHLEGICHIYVDAAANEQMARDVIVNAKMRRTGICGSAETVLIERSAAATMLAGIVDDLSQAGCEIRGDQAAQALDQRIIPATEEDWDTEYLDSIISVAVVDDVHAAARHIADHGSQHTDCIITEDADSTAIFLNTVDSAIVMVNASTQFADGGEFGMGAEIGISTGKLHARGPVGVEQLTSFKYVVRGTGQCRP
ncbi:MAG: glutamate-5-semialdehyde dehydrogenase [Rhodospirillaceae bacterium]|jgi:glutamate-5-semialdehyde dehydrogenase|nr:glutamate-5-semialdehyde dehydrogenase [Rhodospirillaceae bacterium]MBT5243595.1 glutamate-5-semialdehyde dehydrogenase [Rhodospirillaceae bacterium]MBT5562183.1 glutamate-5-semialdehyde dehydrogenase [Rhodospirillaceae bacterium]MBT6242356.1 glutamate-5-semialdehyde dehydrogenase [Rhodospirillaceae bacterium]MBT7138938.1 glutamate-5-semialdehyde dehydrogenase [Rhodospirillaceae bacterium]